MNPAITVRLATPADWSGIWPIFSAVIAGGDTYMLDPETPEPEARAYWMAADCRTYIACIGDEVVGTYTLRANFRGLGAHVSNAGYMVRPGLYGKAIGATMCAHSLTQAVALGYTAMQFNAVVSTNARAVALWQRMGFNIVGTVPGAFNHRTLGFVDIYVMHRLL